MEESKRLVLKRVIYLLSTYYEQRTVTGTYLYITDSRIDPLKRLLHETRDFVFFTMPVTVPRLVFGP